MSINKHGTELTEFMAGHGSGKLELNEHMHTRLFQLQDKSKEYNSNNSTTIHYNVSRLIA